MHWFYGLVLLILLKTEMNLGSELLASTVEECIDKPYGYKIADSTDCHGYMICHGDLIIQQYCALGERYAADIQKCVVGKCPPCNCEGSIPTTPTPTPTTPTATPTTPTPTPTTLTPSTITPTPTIPPPNSTTPDPATFDCSPYEHGRRFPNEFHCRWFWQCVEGRAVALFCELGTWYDRDRYVCNFRNSVKNCPAMQD